MPGLTEARHALCGGLVLPSGPPGAVRLVSRRRGGATGYFHWYSMPAPITF
ncbi:hypothetical protein [Burkholderia sp. LA-2-3-30-S1-D2]|uniref:hypothetical protein n=1 Tax=Burkholderia sp. LA-2-3-30-S1-D2 TaxID=1637862 RepID=UPI00131F1E68|nr:hypothetical protein [Burkholderia sp. LA-2-3-30-S1-D2]